MDCPAVIVKLVDMDGPEELTCAFCGEGIAVHDPMVVIAEDGDRMTSLAMEPALRHAPHDVMHAACAWFFRETPDRARILPRRFDPDADEMTVGSSLGTGR
jgi:hypothetical protein